MQNLKIENHSPAVFQSSKPDKSGGAGEFGKAIKAAINNVSSLEKDADKSVTALLQGRTDVHETMIALQKADISMRMLLTVRSKVMEAYRDIMHMQF